MPVVCPVLDLAFEGRRKGLVGVDTMAEMPVVNDLRNAKCWHYAPGHIVGIGGTAVFFDYRATYTLC